MHGIRRIHSGVYLQQGRGLGSVFSNLIKWIIPSLKIGTKVAAKIGAKTLKDPTVKRAITQVKKSALKTGVNAASNLLAGENVKAGVSRDVKRAKKRIARAIDSTANGVSVPKKRAKKKARSIFD